MKQKKSAFARSKRAPTFTPLYDWIAEKDDLTLLEKCLISRVLRYGGNGCFESNSRLAAAFAVDRNTIIRAIKELIRKEWVLVLYEGRYKRILSVPDERLSAGTLFTKGLTGSGAAPPVKRGKTRQNSGAAPPLSGGAVQQGSGAAPPVKRGKTRQNSGAAPPLSGGAVQQGSGAAPLSVVAPCSTDKTCLINNKKETLKREVCTAAELMKEETKPLSKNEFGRRRRRQLKALREPAKNE